MPRHSPFSDLLAERSGSALLESISADSNVVAMVGTTKDFGYRSHYALASHGRGSISRSCGHCISVHHQLSELPACHRTVWR